MKCLQCPYYEQKTSYGTEIIKCNNDECPYKKANQQWGKDVKMERFHGLTFKDAGKTVGDHLQEGKNND